MRLLGRSEEIVLIAVWRLGDNAYGVSIRDLVSTLTGHEWTLGAIYVPLDKLTRKAFVHKTISDPTAQRGGRSKCMYTLTPEGLQALAEIRKVQNALWDGLPEPVTE